METSKLLDIQPNADTTDNSNYSKELIVRTDVTDTPFTIITIDKKSFGVMGKYRITEVYDTTAECLEEITKITWNRIIQVILLLNETNKEILENLNK